MISQVFKKGLHGRIVAEGSILLIEAKMRWVEVDDQRRCFALEFLKNVFCTSNYFHLVI